MQSALMRFLKRALWLCTALLVMSWVGVTIWAYWPYPSEQAVTALAEKEDRFVSVDGLTLRYREWGSKQADRASLLLIHGFGNSLQSFRTLAPLLAQTHHVIAIDMIGYGLSEKPIKYD